MSANTLVSSRERVKHIYTLMEADAISSEDDVLRLPLVIYYQDAETRKVICYKLRQCNLAYSVDEINKCIRR